MELSVLIQQVSGNGYRASSGEPLVATAEGAARVEALAKLQPDAAADQEPDPWIIDPDSAL